MHEGSDSGKYSVHDSIGSTPHRQRVSAGNTINIYLNVYKIIYTSQPTDLQLAPVLQCTGASSACPPVFPGCSEDSVQQRSHPGPVQSVQCAGCRAEVAALDARTQVL